MNRFSRKRVIQFGSIISLVVFGFVVVWRSQSLGRTTVKPEFDVSELFLIDFPIKNQANLSFTICNPSSTPMCLVGIGLNCGPMGCVESAMELPCTVPPGESKEATVSFKSSGKPGPIEVGFEVYVSSNDRISTHKLCVRGNAIETTAVKSSE